MSVTTTRDERVIVITVTYNPNSYWPPWCQMLEVLVCGTRYISQSCPDKLRYLLALGAVQMVVGLLNLVLAASFRDGCGMISLCCLFIASGVLSVAAVKFPYLALVICSAILNLVGAAGAVTAFGLYAAHRQTDRTIVMITLAIVEFLSNTAAGVFGLMVLDHDSTEGKKGAGVLQAITEVKTSPAA